jgi:hypothetical protein
MGRACGTGGDKCMHVYISWKIRLYAVGNVRTFFIQNLLHNCVKPNKVANLSGSVYISN